jgi:hypothetical protein
MSAVFGTQEYIIGFIPESAMGNKEFILFSTMGKVTIKSPSNLEQQEGNK